MRILVLFGVLALAGCSNLNVNDVIGGAYEAQRVIAESIADECGNSTPGGPCVPGSAISTEDKAIARSSLDLADRYTDAAFELAKAGKAGESLTVLQRASNVLDQLEQFVIQRGIE
jgi:hypothetical protein